MTDSQAAALQSAEQKNDANPQIQTTDDSYFTTLSNESAILDEPPGSPIEVAKGVKSGKELLRRMSLVEAVKPEHLDIDPTAVHPGLNLSGRVISAAICLPYKLGHRAGADWVCTWRGT